MLWLTALLPFAIVAYLYFYHRDSMVWWEYIIPFLVPAILVPAGVAIAAELQARDIEYWGGFVTQTVYYNDWDERVSCRHEIRDDEGDVVGHMHSYDVDYHPDCWVVYGSNGEQFNVSKETYDRLKMMFGNESFKELNRNYHSNDGDSMVSNYPNDPSRCEPLVTKHVYENKTQSSDTVYKFPEVDEETRAQYQLYDYPDVYEQWKTTPVLARRSIPDTIQVEFDRLNGLLGREKEVRVWVMLFEDQPPAAAIAQQNYWKGGNKNELNVCIGVDKEGNIDWARVFSWTEKNRIKVETRDYLLEQDKLDLGAFCKWLYPEIQAQWERKQFAEFSYLKVKLPLSAFVTIWILTIVVSACVVVYVIGNDNYY